MLRRVSVDVFFRLVNGLCLVAFFLQMTFLIVDIIYPEVTNTFSYQLKLHQIDFPVLFKLCTSPGFDHQKLEQFGYLDIPAYFHGQSKLNNSIFGWTGHFTGNNYYSRLDLFNEITTVKNVSSLVVQVYVRKSTGEKLVVNQNMTLRPYYPETCIDIDITAEVANTPIRSITFLLGDLSKYGVHLLLIDKNLATNRPIMEQQLLFSGNDINMGQSSQPSGKSYSVLFEKEVFVENDPSKSCKNYPTSYFANYKSCDNDFLRKAITQALGWPRMPSWLAGLEGPGDKEDYHSANYPSSTIVNMFNGVTLSDCPRPCSTTRVRAKQSRKWKRSEKTSMIDLVPSSTVRETKTDFVKASFTSWLSSFGGALGLWLGLGLCQLAQTIYLLVGKMKKLVASIG